MSMSRGQWKRCPITGIPVSQLPQGSEFDKSKFPDCNLFDVRSIAHAAGFGKQVNNFYARVLTDPSSPLHLHSLRADNGSALSYCTHTDSAIAGGENYRLTALNRKLAGKKWTDVSG
jgi:hypothetical protein